MINLDIKMKFQELVLNPNPSGDDDKKHTNNLQG